MIVLDCVVPRKVPVLDPRAKAKLPTSLSIIKTQEQNLSKGLTIGYPRRACGNTS